MVDESPGLWSTALRKFSNQLWTSGKACLTGASQSMGTLPIKCLLRDTNFQAVLEDGALSR